MWKWGDRTPEDRPLSSVSDARVKGSQSSQNQPAPRGQEERSGKRRGTALGLSFSACPPQRTRGRLPPALRLTDGSVSQARAPPRDKVPPLPGATLLTALLIISRPGRRGPGRFPRRSSCRWVA